VTGSDGVPFVGHVRRFHIADVASEMSKRNLLAAKGDYVPLKTKEESQP
jgi:hypothetical protein